MNQRISAFSIGQTAKVMGVLYALVGVVLMPIFLLAAMFSPDGFGFGAGFAILLPILYGLFGFVGCAIGCAIYNFVAGRVGGIEVRMVSTQPTP